MYETFFGFKDTPFRLSADEKFRYAHKNYLRASAYLAYALQQSEGLVMITGKPGSGKTTLIRDVISELDSAQYCTLHLVTSQLHAEELLRKMALEYGLPAETYNKATLLTNIHKHLNLLHAQGKHSILFLDEAQNLSPTGLEELRLLSNLQEGKDSLLQIVLIGHDDLRQLLLGPGMEHIQQRLVASCQIEPMTPGQTKAYISHRLELVGWQQDPKIQEAVFQLIHEASQGVPRNINHLMSHLLLFASLEEKHTLTDEDALTIIEELVEQQRITLPGEYGFEGFVDKYRAESEQRLVRLAVAGHSVTAPLPETAPPPSREQILEPPHTTERRGAERLAADDSPGEERRVELEPPDTDWFLWHCDPEPSDGEEDDGSDEDSLPADAPAEEPAEEERRSGLLLPNADEIWNGAMASLDMASVFKDARLPKQVKENKRAASRTRTEPAGAIVVSDREHRWGGVWFMSSENSSAQTHWRSHNARATIIDSRLTPVPTLNNPHNIAVDENLSMPSVWVERCPEINPSPPGNRYSQQQKHAGKRPLIRSINHILALVAFGVVLMLVIRLFPDQFSHLWVSMEPRLSESEQDNKRAEIATPPPAESDPEISLPGDPVEVTKERDKGGQLSPPPAPQSVGVPAAEPETETGNVSDAHSLEVGDSDIDSFENIELATRYIVHFDFNGSRISGDYQPLLKSIRDKMLLEENSFLRITGYADFQGERNYNYRLSMKRAEEVKRFFITRGIADERLLVTAVGSVGRNEPRQKRVDARRETRRVEVILFPK
ncbi:MAG: AAA family ATPase [Candidatus Thiodiazotropha sp. (ex Ctena orbiculata)]|nr:AAA family ATPase [Candidatus Thiodiazotropha taylori]MBT2998791.1 AAA family ATPase [Candidatus Thiodiazotropha taylori]MBT3002333.1 AAA family ATPase [Candidatus Thiodiazotropha taylori]MBV2109046.1 AAA family ATPase [Candidatus Thiodiazotropha taylori]MBV2113245.1 AAA family ATPase [Candidatus Thiodiazotropha taylori]